MCSAEEDVTNWDTPAWWRQASRLRQDTAARGRETLAGEEEMVQVAWNLGWNSVCGSLAPVWHISSVSTEGGMAVEELAWPISQWQALVIDVGCVALALGLRGER